MVDFHPVTGNYYIFFNISFTFLFLCEPGGNTNTIRGTDCLRENTWAKVFRCLFNNFVSRYPMSSRVIDIEKYEGGDESRCHCDRNNYTGICCRLLFLLTKVIGGVLQVNSLDQHLVRRYGARGCQCVARMCRVATSAPWRYDDQGRNGNDSS